MTMEHMDYDKYDFTPISGYANVYTRREKHLPPVAEPVILHPELVELMDKLVLQRPRWKFISSRTSMAVRSDGCRHASHFHVFEGDERLGDLDTGVSYRRDGMVRVYQYDTERLRQRRQRGGWTSTTKLDVAVKGILKHFVGKNLTEKLTERNALVVGKLSSLTSNARQTFDISMKSIRDNFANFVMHHWDMMEGMLRDFGATFPDDLPERYAAMEDAVAVQIAYNTGAGATIYIRGSDYFVTRMDRPVSPASKKELTSVMVEPDALAPNYKRSLGLLKLTEVGQVVPGVGVRCAPDTYFIMDSTNND